MPASTAPASTVRVRSSSDAADRTASGPRRPSPTAASSASAATATTNATARTANWVRASTATASDTRASTSAAVDFLATATVDARTAQQNAGYATTSVSRND